MNYLSTTWRRVIGDDLRSSLAVQVSLGVALLTACAQIAIPIQPVPITLQTMGVMFLGLCYSRRAALFSVFAYLAFGAFGMPVYSHFLSGHGILFGSSGGYLMGFFVSVAVMTELRVRFGMKSLGATIANCAIGTVLLMGCGVAWLSQFVGFPQAIQLGLLPFIFPGTIKALILSGAVRYMRKSV